MDKQLEERLAGLEEQLKRFVDVMEQALGRDLARPISAVRDGYYEAALTNAGSIIEAVLRDIWQREGIKGEGKKKTIEQLFSVVKEQAQMDRLVQDYVRDIQLVRNRAAHGEEIVAEDCLEALRKLSVILEWYFDRYVLGGETPATIETKPAEETPRRRRLPWSRIALLALLTLVVLGAVLLKVGQHRRESLRKAQTEYRMVIAPFDAATAAARDEAVTMRQLLFAALAEVVENESNVKVMTPESDKPPRTDGEARRFGDTHLADVTIWGRVVSVGGDTVIEPHIVSTQPPRIGWLDREASDATGRDPGELRAVRDAGDHFTLRQAKANEVRDLAVVLAATRGDIASDRALSMLREIETADSFFHQGDIAWGRGLDNSQARALFERALAADPEHDAARVCLAITSLHDDDFEAAAHHCDQMGASTGYYRSGFCAQAYEEVGRYEDADRTLAAELGDDTEFSWYGLRRYSSYLLRRGQIDRAIEMLQQHTSSNRERLFVGNLMARNELAWILGWLDRHDEAIYFLEGIPTRFDPDLEHIERRNAGVRARDTLDLALANRLNGVAASVFALIEELSDGGALIAVDSRIRLALATENYLMAHEEVDAALSEYYWSSGKRRWLTWSTWKGTIGAALGLQRDAYLEPEYNYSFNPGIAQQWHAYIHLFEGQAKRTTAILAERDDSRLEMNVWGWRGQPQALAAHLDDPSGQAWTFISQSDDRGRGSPALALLALSQHDDRRVTDEWIEALRASPENWDWLTHGSFGRFVRGELSEEELKSYTPFREWTPWYRTCKPNWTLMTSLDLGAYFLATGNTEKARSHLQTAVDTDLRYQIEWLLAKHALDRLEPR